MATIVVEDGTGTNSAANSYVSESDLTTYATDRGITLTATAPVLLIKSMDYLESLQYNGVKLLEDQPLQWPRMGVYIGVNLLDKNTIPKNLKNAQLATAVAIDQGQDPLAPIARATKREKVDVIEVEYMDGSAPYVINRTIMASLSNLLANGAGGGSNFAVNRA